MTIDEAIVAHDAARKLRALYRAYRATSRANAIVLKRVAGQLDVDDPETPARLSSLRRRVALSRETDEAYALRSEDLRKRMLRLREEFSSP